MITTDITTFNKVVKYITMGPKKYGIMIRGPHGIGKSEIVSQFAATFPHEFVYFDGDDYKDKKGLDVVDRRASQMTDGDLLGMPKVKGKATTFLPPQWYLDACERPVFLFFDELDRATLEVRQGLFQLGCSREMNGHVLHPGTLLFTAINGGVHKQASQYLVNNLGPAEQDRWFVIDLQPTVKEWLAWANGKVEPEVHSFIASYKDNPKNFLEHHEQFESGVVYPSRRSWKRLSDCLTQMKKDVQCSLKEVCTTDMFLSFCYGFVGEAATIAFIEHIKTMKERVTPDDIINKGRHDLLANFKIEEFTDLIDQFDADEWFTKVWDDVQLENMVKFFNLLPSELLTEWLIRISFSFNEDEHDLNFYKQTNFIRFYLSKINGEPVLHRFVSLAEMDESKAVK
jgi:hypothetical protein